MIDFPTAAIIIAAIVVHGVIVVGVACLVSPRNPEKDSDE